MQVYDRRVEIAGGHRIEHLLTALHAGHPMAGLLQQPLQDHAVGLVVVGHQQVHAAHAGAVAQERVGEGDNVATGVAQRGLGLDLGHRCGYRIVPGCLRRTEWQLDPEAAAPAFGTLETDPATHRLGQAPGNGLSLIHI